MEITFFNSLISSDQVFTLLRERLGLEFTADAPSKTLDLQGVSDARLGGSSSIVFAARMSFEELEQKLDSCFVLVEQQPPRVATSNIYCVVEDARATFIDLLSILISQVGVRPFTAERNLQPDISATAVIAPSAVIEDNVVIADGAVISAGCVIRSGTQVGKNSIIRENTIVGIDGITLYKAKDGRVLKFPHVCNVRIGEGCEIGANCVIPKGILTPTTVGNHVVIGNLCNIGHGARVADHVWMSVGTLVGGHTQVGTRATIGMGGCIRDNLTIGEGAAVGMGSVVVKDVEPGASVFGSPAKRMAALATGPKR
jgi:UDP-3-O-[3-hydroxymyristoyl] glucosamine N-acyltransferase